MSLDQIKPYAKAIVGGMTAAVGAGATAAIDNQITYGEWWTIVGAFLAGLGVVYAVPNKDPQAIAQDESTQPPGA